MLHRLLRWAVPPISRACEVLVVAVTGLLVGAFFWRDTLGSGFERISGNLGDNRLILALHEHWYAVFRGRDVWDRPLFFWGADHVLAFSDTAFLTAMPYGLLRASGAEPYVSFQLVLIGLTLVGFASGYVLLRCDFAVPRSLALLGATVLAYSAQVAFARLSAQTLYVCLAPLLLILLLRFLREVVAERPRALAFGVSLALLLGATFFSSFNFAWFFTFLVGLTAVIWAGMNRSALRGAVTPRRVAIVVATFVVFVAALSPFFFLYGPLVLEGFSRSYAQALPHLVSPSQLVNRTGVFWSFGGPRVPLQDLQHYAVTPGVGIAFVAACVWLARGGQPIEAGTSRALLGAIAVAVVLATALTVRIGDTSSWWLVHQAVPGAAATRVVARFLHVIGILAVVVAFAFLGAVFRSGGATVRAVVAGAGLLLALEQVAAPPVGWISRSAETNRIMRVPLPPPGTDVFFVVMAPPEGGARRSAWPNLTAQIDAMLVAERFGIPTVNGYSGWSPENWDLSYPWDSGSYLDRVRAWLERTGIQGHVAVLDLGRRRWTALGPIRPVAPAGAS